MIELGQHAQYIVGAWSGVTLVTLGLILWTLRDAANQKRRLEELESRGVRRRSAKTDSPS